MSGLILLLQEQCEPLDEFMAMVHAVQNELENARAIQYIGRGLLTEDFSINHGFILDELLYPMIDKCNPSQLYVKVNAFHIEIRLT